MALAFCPQCRTKLPEGVAFCPQCGERLPVAPTSARGAGRADSPSTPSTPSAAPPAGQPPVSPPLSQPPSGSSPTPGRPDQQPEEGLGGLARRWLKTQINVSLDPLQGRRNEQEARRIENEVEQRAEKARDRAIFEAVVPQGLKDMIAETERNREAQKLESERRRRAEHEARPRADVYARFSGAVTGELRQPLPVTVNRPEEPGEALTVELDPLEPIPVAGHAFLGLWFAVPKYAGQGSYDLQYYEPRDDWDAALFQLMFDSTDEPLYWTSDYGPGVVTVEPDERTFTLRLAMEDAGSRHVDVQAVVVLPG